MRSPLYLELGVLYLTELDQGYSEAEEGNKRSRV